MKTKVRMDKKIHIVPH